MRARDPETGFQIIGVADYAAALAWALACVLAVYAIQGAAMVYLTPLLVQP